MFKDLKDSIDKQRIYEYSYMFVLAISILSNAVLTIPQLTVDAISHGNILQLFAGIELEIMFIFNFILNDEKPKNSYHILSIVTNILTSMLIPFMLVLRIIIIIYGIYCLIKYYSDSTYEFVYESEIGDDE